MGTSSKFQHPSSKESSSFNIQTRIVGSLWCSFRFRANEQLSGKKRVSLSCLEFLWSLDVGAWCFFCQSSLTNCGTSIPFQNRHGRCVLLRVAQADEHNAPTAFLQK